MLSGDRLRTTCIAVGGVVLLGLVVAACSAATSHGARHEATSTSATSAPTTTATSVVPVTNTATFPVVIVQAMAQFSPLPAGARAPVRLPSVQGYITAQTVGLAGEDNVTLIATSQPEPVNSPALSSANAGREVASFKTTPTASPSNAQANLAQQKSNAIVACGGPSSPLRLANGTAATTCPTLDGAAIDWSVGPWAVQVLTLDGTTPSTAEADHLVGELGSLPASDVGGIVSVVVPGNPSAGTADTAALAWTVGADAYQVRSSDDPDSAVFVADAMRPYPA